MLVTSANTVQVNRAVPQNLFIQVPSMTYYTVYQTTNLINGMIYIGVHKTNDPYDDYFGSGKLILNAIEEYGIDNFQKDILCYCNSKDEMYLTESEIVDEDFILREDTYNIRLGGDGGWDHIDYKTLWSDPEFREKHSEALKKSLKDPKRKENLIKALRDPNYRKNMAKTWRDFDIRKNRITGMKKSWQNPETKKKASQSAKERWQDPEQRKKQSETRKGGIWVHCPETDVVTYIHKDMKIPKGFVRGKKPKAKK